MKMHNFYSLSLFQLICGSPVIPPAKPGAALQRDSRPTHENYTHIEMKLKQNGFKQLWNCFVSVSFQCADS